MVPFINIFRCLLAKLISSRLLESISSIAFDSHGSKFTQPRDHVPLMVRLRLFHVIASNYSISADLETIGKRLDATEREGRSTFFILRDDLRPSKVAFLCKTGAARKRVSLCIPTEQDFVKKKLFGGRFAVVLDCLHAVNSLVAWSHPFLLRPFADGGEELLPGFCSVTGLDRGLLGYRSDLLNPRERPRGRAEFLRSLEDFYTVRFPAGPEYVAVL